MSKDKASERINSRVSKPHKKQFSVLMVIIPVVVFIAITVVVITILAGKDSETNVVVSPDNVQDVIDNLKDSDRTPIGSFETSMNTTWHFANDSTASSDAYVGNSVNNRNTVYFTISLEGSSDIIYKSPYIPVGSSLKDITLDTDLKAGTYNTVLKYHLVDDSYKDISNVSVSLTIIIEN